MGKIIGKVVDANTEEPLPFVKVFVENKNIGAITNIEGKFIIEIETGTYNVTASFVGYKPQKKFNIVVTSGNAQVVNFKLEKDTKELKTVNVTYDNNTIAKTTDMVTPLSVQQLTSQEIKSNPGGNFDVSKVVQTLPGVGGSGGGAQRNDIIIRGGAPNENVYYLDGIEIPVLNHFQTQGSSGGAQGILNVSFIDNLKLSSSAFDARYDNALASTFVINQRQGNSEKISGNIRASFTESLITLEGPLGKKKKTDFLISARKSYLDLLFTAIDLPIRPNFSDFQFKVTNTINNKSSITLLGLGAIDNFKFATTKNSTPENEYLVRSLPFIKQWNYTIGGTYKYRIKNGFLNFSLSRNMFDNQLDQFEDAKNGDENYRNLLLKSQEIENKMRFDMNHFVKGWKVSYGLMGQYVKYNTNLYNRISKAIYDQNGNLISPEVAVTFNSAIDFYKFGLFTQVSKSFFKDKLLVSSGVRTDMNTFLDDGLNPGKTMSPRLSLAYHLTEKLDITGSVGRYFKIPIYTALGYRDAQGNLVNKSMKYINSNHFVAGFQYLPKSSLRITLEGFYKIYNNYPVSLTTGISLANQGSEFGSVGNEPFVSTGKGKAYGFEFFLQQKMVKNLFYIISYTYVRSLFSGLDEKLLPSAWDNQHLFSTTLGYNFKKNWKLGLKYRFAGGVPYTPFDFNQSQQVYATIGKGVLDYSQINTLRLKNFNQLDLRLDKIVNFKKTSIDFYIDIQNVLASKQESPPYFTFKRNEDNTGFETTDGLPLKPDGSNAIPVLLKNESRLITPTIGLIFEF
jgi:outer membrane receptor for ferrienterochelin and colicin